MEGNVFDRLQHLITNANQIDISLSYERELLRDLLSKKGVTSSVKEKTKDIERFNNEATAIRKEISKCILKIKEQHREDTKADVGIIYNFKQQQKNLSELHQILKAAAIEHEVSIICFRINDIDVENDYVKGTLISSQGVKDIISKIPPLVYNMGYFTKLSNIKKMKQLRRLNNVELINPINKFNQYIIFEMVSELCIEKPGLLDYTIFSRKSMYSYLEKYDSIYLFPENINDEKKKIKIEKSHNGYSVYIGVNKTFIKKSLYEYILKVIQKRKYFIIEAPKAIEIEKVPLEIRVHVQKGKKGNWEVTNLVTKIQWYHKSTNSPNSSLTFSEALSILEPDKSEEIERNLKKDAINISSYLENYLSNIGSSVVDFIITEEGHNHFISFGGWEDKELFDNQDSRRLYLDNAIDYLIHLRAGD